MLVVLDTNVFVSGVFWSGPPAKTLDAWVAGRFRLAMSPEIFDEYERVLGELGARYPSVRKYAALLSQVAMLAEWVVPPPLAQPVCSDPDDDKFLAAAAAARANYLVSGDRALLRCSYPGGRVLQAREFLAALGK